MDKIPESVTKFDLEILLDGWEKMLPVNKWRNEYGQQLNPYGHTLFVTLREMAQDERDEATKTFLVTTLRQAATAALCEGRTATVPGDTGTYNEVCDRIFKTIIVFLINAIEEGKTTRRCGSTYYNCLLIPDWFVKKFKP